MHVTDLTSLRQQIDAIDEELVELLARRFKVTNQVGQLKAALGLQAVDATREAEQAERLQSLAVRHAVNSDLVHRIFRLIVEEVVQNHQAIARGKQPTKF